MMTHDQDLKVEKKLDAIDKTYRWTNGYRWVDICIYMYIHIFICIMYIYILYAYESVHLRI